MAIILVSVIAVVDFNLNSLHVNIFTDGSYVNVLRNCHGSLIDFGSDFTFFNLSSRFTYEVFFFTYVYTNFTCT